MASTPKSAPVHSSPGSATGKCVMLVDDEPAYIDLLEQLLSEHLSCPVLSFTKPADALRALDHSDVGLIVTDYHMPEMNGLEFIAEVQRRRPGIPAVMITAHEVNPVDQPGVGLPALKAVVRKPFRWTALAEHISLYWPGVPPPFPRTAGNRSSERV
ncbi:MAG: response regulator [Opitutales bacterium]